MMMLYLFLGLIWPKRAVPIALQSQGHGCLAAWEGHLESDTLQAHNGQTGSGHYYQCWFSVEKNKMRSRYQNIFSISQTQATTWLCHLSRHLSETPLALVPLSKTWTPSGVFCENCKSSNGFNNRPAVMNPILAVKCLCDLLYWSN